VMRGPRVFPGAVCSPRRLRRFVFWASLFRPARFGSAVKSDKIQGADGEDSSDVADRNPLATVAHGQTLAEAIVDTVREPLVVLDQRVAPFTGLSRWRRRIRRAEGFTN
jgi:hypothetical protein